MPRVTDLPDFTFKPDGTGGDRSPGLHQSDIIHDIYATLYPKRFARNEVTLPWDLFVLGWAWENALSVSFRELDNVILHPGEVESDGIIQSPDALGISRDGNWAEEYKATYMSERGTSGLGIMSDKFSHWHMQTMGYLRTLGLVTVVLRVYFVCGDYTYPIQPAWRAWRITYDQRELDENWGILVRHASHKGWL